MSSISILIPAYNCSSYIADTLNSILNQTYTDWEAIIIDDCSEDDTWTIAQTYASKDSRIKVYRNERNLGMLSNWNYGISLCKSPFFVKLDADDIWHPHMLEKALQVLQNYPDVGLVFSRYINIDEQGCKIPSSDLYLPDFAANKPFSCIPLVHQGPDKMLSYPILRQGLSLMRREVFDRIGNYHHLLTKETQASTDTEFYFRLGAHYQIFCIDEVLYKYRIHTHSISAQDTANNLSDRKLFEIKWCIINYYINQRLLDAQMGKRYLRQVATIFDFQQAAFYRKNGKIKLALQIIAKRLTQNPAGVLFFYTGRIIQKLK